MRAAGFTYHLSPLDDIDLPVEDIASPSSRSKFGYLVRVNFERSLRPRADPNGAYESSLSATGQRLFAESLARCTADATKVMGISQRVVDELTVEEFNRRLEIMADLFWQRPDTMRLLATYRKCMKAKGFDVNHYSDPTELLPYDLGRLVEDADYRRDVFEREDEVSKVDATCMARVYDHLRSLWLKHAQQELADIAPLLR